MIEEKFFSYSEIPKIEKKLIDGDIIFRALDIPVMGWFTNHFGVYVKENDDK